MKLFLQLLTALMICKTAWAHEGHDHDVPKNVVAPKGGQIKAVEETLIEVVSKGNDLKVYFYTHDLKPKDLTGFKISAKAEKPRNKKQDNIDLKAGSSSYEAVYDAQGIHRYTLILSVKDPAEDHADIIKYIIEPKK